jgi:voltage-gated potassium channel
MDMDVRIARISGRHIICGYGRVGVRVARELDGAAPPFVVVDANPDAVRRAQADGLAHVDGDGAQEDVLAEPG